MLMFNATLKELMDVAYQAASEIASHEELGTPLLAYVRRNGTIGHAALLVPNVHPSTVAKVVLAAEEATMAVLAMESWKVSIEPTPEQRAAFEAGEVPSLDVMPRDHPDRYDALIVIGEIKGEPQIQRHWRIRTEPGQSARTFEEEEVPGGSPQPSRFTPLFVPFSEAQELAAQSLMRAYLRDQTQTSRN